MTQHHYIRRLCSALLIMTLGALSATASPITTQAQKARTAARTPIKTAAKNVVPPKKGAKGTAVAASQKKAADKNTKASKDTKSAKNKANEKKTANSKVTRARKNTPPPALIAQPKNMPLTSDIPMAIATLLADGEIDAASRRLYMEPASVKNIMLIREIERIMEGRNTAKPSKAEAHRFYLNQGIAYHNLALFLKSKGLESKKFVQKALAAYAKAKTSDKNHRGEVETLRSALLAAHNKRKAAIATFTKQVDTKDLLSSYHGSTYLATYYAATGEADRAVAALQNAKQLDTSGNLKTWAQIGDDFTWIRATPEFQAMLNSWKK